MVAPLPVEASSITNADIAKTKSKPRFRTDIEGMRAFALILVIVYHGGVKVLPGSYIGVDMFFIISGFLITGLLMKEIEKTGTISLRTFYARRIRRLVPVSVFVVVCTLIAAKILVPPLMMTGVARDALASSTQLMNMWLSYKGTDYLSDQAPSIFQHYWSLAVEEQFYLLWPMFILVIARKPLKRLSRTAFWIATLTAVSFALCVVVTLFVNRGWAYFLLPTRAWELAAGALLALAVPWTSRMPVAAKIAVGWGGVAVLLVGALLMDASMAFPGFLALVPVVGTLAILLGDGHSRGPTLFLGTAPFQFLGRISYSVYLWHWPLLTIAAIRWSRPLTVPEGMGLVAISIVLGYISYRLIESPFRQMKAISRTHARSIAFGAVITAASLLVALSVYRIPPLAGGPDAPSPSVAQIATGAAFTEAVPANLTPPLVDARAIIPAVYTDNCEAGYGSSSPKDCVYGNPDSDRTIVLFGDSHATQWFPMLESYATERGMKLVTMTKSACTPVPLDIYVYGGQDRSSFTECDQFRQNVIADLERTKPEMVVIGAYSQGYDTLWRGSGDYRAAWISGVKELMSTLPAGVVPVMMGDNPRFTWSTPVCLSAHLEDASACSVPREEALDAELTTQERAVVESAGGVYADTASWLCASETCEPTAGNLLIYRDDHHVTVETALRMSENMVPVLDNAVGRSSR